MMLCALLVAGLLSASGALAQTAANPVAPAAQAPEATTPPAPPPDPLGRSSPHGCVVGFLLAAQKQDYARAAQYLDTKKPEEQAEELARQLQTVLDAGLTGTLDGLSRESTGNATDNQEASRDLVGTVKTSHGSLDIVVERVQRRGEPPIWLFSSDTLAQVHRLSEELSGSSLDDKLPRWMVSTTLFSVPVWHWLGLLIGILIILGIARLLSRLLQWVLGSALGRILPVSGERVIRKLQAPLFLLLLAGGMRFFSQYSLTVLSRQFWNEIAVVVLIVGIAWLLICIIDLVAVYLTQGPGGSVAVARATFVGVAVRILKIAAVLFAGLALLSRAGVNVSALLAGLGIGGIALALGAQKTLENFFGGITIVGQQALRVGDLCKIGDDMGIVEDIGLSSLKLRTFDRCLVTLPNSKVVQQSIQNFSFRDKFFIQKSFSLRHDMTSDQVTQIQSRIERLLQETRDVESGSRVRLIDLSPSGLRMEIWAYLLISPVADFARCAEAQEQIFISVLKILEETGAALAPPWQTPS
ncbi:MAG TPA: mechanosensitive ion channel family protein [Silvibacterium sp.]|nr:mechanosensitive ion channel family protein [Silvibacterium sp.]